MRSPDASLCFGAGVAAFMLGQDAVAQARFECAVRVNPGFLPAARWLGDLHYRKGQIAEAIAIYEAASQRSPEARDLQQQLDEWRREQTLQSSFIETRTDHFRALFGSAADAALARKIVERLEASYSRIGSTLGVYPSRTITVMLYTREQFDAITRLADWSAAAYDGRIRVPISGALEEPDELDRVLSHEFAHALIAMVGGRTVPAWVNEGLATALEPVRPNQAASRPASTKALLAPSKLQRGFTALSRRQAELAYASASQAVGRLIELRGIAALVLVLDDLSRGVPFPAAFHKRMGMRYEDFDPLAPRE
jgi:tetratricopeptide (TPR) repeat protein